MPDVKTVRMYRALLRAATNEQLRAHIKNQYARMDDDYDKNGDDAQARIEQIKNEAKRRGYQL